MLDVLMRSYEGSIKFSSAFGQAGHHEQRLALVYTVWRKTTPEIPLNIQFRALLAA